MNEESYKKAQIWAGVMKNCLEDSLIETDKEKGLQAWNLAMLAKQNAEDLGYPLSYSILRVQDWDSEHSTLFISVAIYRVPPNASPEAQAKYDRWFKNRIGIADESDESEPPFNPPENPFDPTEDPEK